MKERGILFAAPMVRAILEKRKKKTRRIVKPQRPAGASIHFPPSFEYARCPYGQPGDRLWVRETWHPGGPENNHDGVIYRATDPGWDDNNTGLRWRPAIFMPRWASRITLDVTDVRAERLHDITEEDARAEGVASRAEFADLWRSINGAESWAANPWVWVVSFSPVSECGTEVTP